MNECPNTFPAFKDRKDFSLYATLNPAKHVGGDFYDYSLLDDDHLAIVIADVVGKGIPAALNMVKTKQLIKGSSLYVNDPSKVLSLVNTGFLDGNKLDAFVTVWFGIIEISKGKLSFANAGHDDPIIYTEKKGFELLKTKHGLPIGAMKDSKYENTEITLSKGDKLFLYTDGVIDSVNEKNKRYDIYNLLKVLNKNKNKDPKEIITSVKEDIDNYSKGCKQFDDITMLCFELFTNSLNNHIILNKRFSANLKEIDNIYAYFKDPIIDNVKNKNINNYYVVIDEIFSNIVNYGFNNNSKDNYVDIKLDIDKEKKNIKITFEDNGIPFNPLEKDDPNIDLSINKRKEGGLGIFIVKKMMDNVSYEYKNNKNIFVIEKKY